MANTLAYYNTAAITAVKSFIVQAPGWSNLKLVKLPLGPCSDHFPIQLCWQGGGGLNKDATMARWN